MTGGAKRIGRAIALHLHHRGFDIALHYRGSLSSAQALADALNTERPQSCTLFQADLEDTGQVASMARDISDHYAAVDLLVNNASGFLPTPLETCTPREFDTMLDVNLRGPYFLVQGLLPALGRSGHASIVNLVDVHAQRPLRHYNAYCAAKAGLASLTRSLALELAPAIRVNGVAPGAILWPEEGGSYDEAMRRETLERTPLGRLGEPGDIAATVAFLACDAPYITGQVIDVDGGRALVS